MILFDFSFLFAKHFMHTQVSFMSADLFVCKIYQSAKSD